MTAALTLAVALYAQVQMDIIIGRNGSVTVVPRGRRAAPAPRPVPKPMPMPTPPMPPPPAEVLAILEARCRECHTTARPNGLAMFDAAGRLLPLAPLDLVLVDQVTYGGEMPPDVPLTLEEYAAIRAWIDDDRDAIKAAAKACRPGTARPAARKAKP